MGFVSEVMFRTDRYHIMNSMHGFSRDVRPHEGTNHLICEGIDLIKGHDKSWHEIQRYQLTSSEMEFVEGNVCLRWSLWCVSWPKKLTWLWLWTDTDTSAILKSDCQNEIFQALWIYYTIFSAILLATSQDTHSQSTKCCCVLHISYLR